MVEILVDILSPTSTLHRNEIRANKIGELIMWKEGLGASVSSLLSLQNTMATTGNVPPKLPDIEKVQISSLAIKSRDFHEWMHKERVAHKELENVRDNHFCCLHIII
ncbi:hypothetical protein QJS10_CPB20g00308 [Acorus calamus]|uniref:Uncharacterized protein n=1 Tax=Acorus calamus TaxID=4465 RepID=A0AAV9CCI0_ACOCL|nr:hypothetical protein QJS10_CPB20g00308 [Acorus calamus]